MMRRLATALLVAILALPAWSIASADPGVEAERISRASALDDGYGAVVISLRSEIYLDEPLQVFFLRVGGDVSNPADVVRFERRQGFFSFGNDTVNFKIRTYALREGFYRLIAHGMDCTTIPAENERCLVEVPGLLGRRELSRPSRGYPDIAPTFEVRSGSVTYAGDFALTARNTIEWSEIPQEELRQVSRRFGRLSRGDDPIIPGEFRRKYGLFPRSYEDDAGRRY